MPDIGSYINQNWPIANSYKECNLDKAHGKSIVPKLGSIPVPESLLWRLFPQILWEHSNAFTASVPKILVGKTFQQGL